MSRHRTVRLRRREVLGFAANIAVLGAIPAAHGAAPDPRVRVETALGSFDIEVYVRRAVLTAANFLRYVDGGYLSVGSIYRIVTPTNQHPEPPVPASIVQWGMGLSNPDDPRPFPPPPHESTRTSGLTHRDGAVSLARFAPGTGTSEFFICIGDQPEFDAGGRRNPDGAGFAVFGQVVEGRSVLDRIYARAESDHLLKHRIPITRVARLAAAPA